MTEEIKKPTEAENQAETELEGVDFGEENQEPTDEFQASQEEETEEPPEPQAPKKEINQDAVQKRIDEITFEKYEEKRKREKIEKELQELRASLEKKKAAEEEIVIPDLPDVYADDYDEKVKERDEALRKAAKVEFRKELKKEEEQKRFQADFERRQNEVLKNVDAMYSSASEYGIDKNELKEADEKVSKFINDPELARFLVARKDAALIVKHLSSSVEELEKVKNMSPVEASVYIATEVSAAARKLKPDLTKTPDPPEIPRGKSTPKKDPFLDGVVLE